MKNGRFAQNAITKLSGVEPSILATNYIILGHVYATRKRKKIISAFNLKLLHVKLDSPCKNRKLVASLTLIFIPFLPVSFHMQFRNRWTQRRQITTDHIDITQNWSIETMAPPRQKERLMLLKAQQICRKEWNVLRRYSGRGNVRLHMKMFFMYYVDLLRIH